MRLRDKRTRMSCKEEVCQPKKKLHSHAMHTGREMQWPKKNETRTGEVKERGELNRQNSTSVLKAKKIRIVSSTTENESVSSFPHSPS